MVLMSAIGSVVDLIFPKTAVELMSRDCPNWVDCGNSLEHYFPCDDVRFGVDN